jgi:acetylglutamate kinase
MRAVVKLGGEVVARPAELSAVVADVADLCQSGWSIAICHGGGPQANALQERLGVPVVKVAGRRVTDAATLQIVKCVLAGEVNVDLVAAALAAGVRAVGISGVSARLVSAHRRPPKRVAGGGEEPVDFGLVGDIDAIETDLVEHLWAGGFTPVVASLGVGVGEAPCPVYNINADTVASAIAGAVGADHLFLVTDVPGVLRDRDDLRSRIPVLRASEARAAIEAGTIVGGMIPKVEEALAGLARGIGAVHVLGPSAGALAQAAREPGSRGTAVVAG